MFSKTLRASSILLSLITFICLQNPQSASAREYREKCEDRLKITQYGTPTYDEREGWDYSEVEYDSKVVNECTGETAIGVVTGFGNGGTSTEYKSSRLQFAPGLHQDPAQESAFRRWQHHWRK